MDSSIDTVSKYCCFLGSTNKHTHTCTLSTDRVRSKKTEYVSMMIVPSGGLSAGDSTADSTLSVQTKLLRNHHSGIDPSIQNHSSRISLSFPTPWKSTHTQIPFFIQMTITNYLHSRNVTTMSTTIYVYTDGWIRNMCWKQTNEFSDGCFNDPVYICRPSHDTNLFFLSLFSLCLLYLSIKK